MFWFEVFCFWEIDFQVFKGTDAKDKTWLAPIVVEIIPIYRDIETESGKTDHKKAQAFTLLQ